MIISTIPASNCTPQTIVIGRRGTYDTMQIAFDLSYLVESYGNGVAVLAVKRSQDESAYPAVTSQADNTLTWTITETDTYYVGSGECQLMWYVDGGLAKTIIYPMVVMRDILSTSEEPPDGYENWVEHLTELGAETQQNAQNAARSASDAEAAKDDTVAAKEDAETAVTHYPKIENNYWMVWDVASQSYVSTGIQAEGEDGYSPEISITTITGGHRVTITDKDHPQGQSFDVMDGQGGGGGGTTDYTDLTNKPQINGHTLSGNQSVSDLGLGTYSKPASGIPKTDFASDVQASLGKADSALQTAPVTSVNSKTGAVTLDAGDIGYDNSENYNSGTVGHKVSELNRHLNDKQDAPETAGTAGQVLSLDSQLNPVWSTPSGGGGDVTDVQINGTSILSGGVANIPVASNSVFGVTKGSIDYGIDCTASGIRTAPATEAQIKVATGVTALYNPVVPYRQHISTFYGLAKAAGDATQSASANAVGTYTEDAKSAIHTMLSAPVTVSGTTPTIAAKSGITYVCGEVATLDITIPASGIFEVQFVSGSTPTVLTATGVTWANGFDPTALEANKTYDISISNGIGVAVWI